MTIRSLAVVMIAGILIAGCKTSPITTDYAMVPNLSRTTAVNAYPNSAIPLKLEVKTEMPGEVEVEYVESGVAGILSISDKTIRAGERFRHNFSEPLYMTFTPDIYGTASLKFKIYNERTVAEAKVTFTVNQPAYQLDMLTDTVVTVGIKEDLAFVVQELETITKAIGVKAGGSKYKITAQITKGRGVLQVKDKILVDDSQTKASVKTTDRANVDVEDNQTETATKATEPASVDVIKDQETPFYYTSLTSGENNIDFNVSDEFGNTVTTPVKLKAQNPMADFKISLKQDSVYKAAVLHEFTVFPDANGLDRKFKLSWTIDPKGDIKDITVMSKSLPVPAGDQVELKANTANPLSVITQSTGKMGLAFQFEDEYGSKYDSTVMLTIISPSIDFIFPESFPDLSEWKPYEWTGNLVAEAGTNTYQISYKNEDPEAGTLTINGVAPVDGDRTDLLAGKNVFKYTPKKAGIHNLTFVVYDKFGNEKTYPVKFTVGSNQLGVTVGNVSPVNYGQSVNVNINIPNQEHIKAFQGVVSSLNGGTATIEVNGSKVTENKELDLKTGTNVFNITPTTVASEYAFKLLVKTDIGQEEVQEITVPIVLPELNATVTELVKDCDLTGTLIYELTIQEPHYTGKFTISPSIVQGTDGTLSIGGKSVTNNQSTTIDKAGTVPVVFTPKSTGDVEINIRVSDENSQEEVVSLKGNVGTPNLTATTSATGATIKYKTETPFTLTINEALHPEAFSVTPTFVKGSGVLMLEEDQLTPGVKVDVKAGTHNLTFIPNDCGETDIQFLVIDKHNTEALSHALFTIEPYPLSFVMDNVSASEVNITVPVTFTFDIQEQEAPDGPYTLTYSSSKQGTVKIDNAVVGAETSKTLNKGTHNLSYTPTASGSHQVVFTLRDMFGQEKTATLNVEAKNAPLQASASVGNAATNIKKAASFTISASEADYTGQFPTTVTNTGSGTLTANGSAVTFGKEFNVSSGNTTMAYTPNALGDHKLSFIVKDIYGQSKEFSVNIHADYAAMTATANAPTSMYVNRAATIALSLAEDNYTSNFTASYTGGTGVLKNGTTAWSVGSGYSIAGGSTNLTYTPTTTGSHQLNFTFTDSYGQSKQSSVTINVTQASLTASATPNSATVYVGSTATSTLAISEAEHSGQFTVQPIISGNGTLSINGTNVGSSGTIKVTGGNSTIGYTPGAPGTHTVTFNVTDAHGQSTATTLTVSASHPEIAASATSASTFKTKPVEVVLNLDKPNYTGTFTTNVRQSGNGSLTISGGGSANGALTLGKGATRFTYTPTANGTHTITFNIATSDGQSKTVTSSITVTESPLSVNLSPSVCQVPASGSETNNRWSDVAITVSRSYYSGNLRLELFKVTTPTTYPQNNSVHALVEELPNGTFITDIGIPQELDKNWTDAKPTPDQGKAISKSLRIRGFYNPSAPGNATKRLTLHFRVSDDNGQRKEFTCDLNVEMP